MILSSLCVILLVLWTLLAYVAIPLPVGDPLFAWLKRQWLVEGIACLAFLAVISAVASRWRMRSFPRVAWWNPWWLWILWAGLSLTYTIDRGSTVRGWLSVVSYGLIAYAVCLLIESPSDLLTWMRFLVGVSIVACFHGFLQYVGTFDLTLPLMERLQETGQGGIEGWQGEVMKDFLLRKRIFSVFGWPNLFAGFLLLMIPPAVGLSFQGRSRFSRIGWAIASAVFGLSLMLTLSMGGWIAAIFTGCVAWWLLRRSRVRVSGAPARGDRALPRLLLFGFAVSGVLLITSLIVAKRAKSWILWSVGSRLVYVQGAWNVLRTHPVAGTGLGTFGIAYQTLKPLEQTEGQHTALHAHNTFLEVGAELGIVGLGLFIVFCWRVGRFMIQSARAQAVRDVTVLQRGLVIGLLGFFVHSLLEQTFFEAVTAPFWWIALGLLSGASSLSQTEASRFVNGAHRTTVVALPLLVGCVGLALTPRLITADLWAARAALQDLAGKRQEGWEAFEQAMRWDPLASRYPLEQGERLLKSAQRAPPEQLPGLLDQARKQVERAVTLSPWLGFAWLRLGVVRWHLGQRDPAVFAMQEAVRRDPNSRAALIQLAQMLSAAGRSEDLRRVAEHFQRLEPASPLGFFWEALAWQGLGKSEGAIGAYRRAVERFPDHFPSLFNLAELLRSQGSLEETARAYESFLRVAPAEERTRRLRAQAFLKESLDK